MLAAVLLHAAVTVAVISWEAPEPYEEIHDFCADCLPEVSESPDPLVRYTWSDSVNTSRLQYYRVSRPVSYRVIPEDARIEGLEGFFGAFSTDDAINHLKVYQNCTILLDWGVERAAWFEMIAETDWVNNTNIQVTASVSEFNQPYPGKTKQFVKYNNTFRLETNDELYEGVRFSFLHIQFAHESTTDCVEISDLSLVAKIKPIAYTGTFTSSDPMLTQAWYTGAYAVRLNMEEDDFNSILIERGDRVAIQGDGHPTMAAALVAFTSHDLIQNVLNQTDSAHKHVVDDNIMAYPLYWCLSAIDYFMASGDVNFFRNRLVSDIAVILDERIDDFLDPNLDVTWFGWDDRIGNGWCFHSKHDKCTREALLAFAALVIRVCNDFVGALTLTGKKGLANKYAERSISMSQRLRQVPEYPHGFGVHAASNVLNTKTVATAEETEYWMSTTLNDPVTICSFSAFNQYWILQGFDNVGTVDAMEHALQSINICWGPMLKLGKGCFWEISSPEWLAFMKEGDQAPHLPSYCHPWASGVTPWLTHALAGLKPLLPGYKEFIAMPYVSSTHPSVIGQIETPHGHLTIDTTLHSNMTIRCHIETPLPGIFSLRSTALAFDGSIVPLDKATIRVNGAHVQFLSDDVPSWHFNNAADAAVFFRLENSHTYFVDAHYQFPAIGNKVAMNHRRLDMALAFPEPSYPARTNPLDRKSQGNGLLTYGKDGYVLFGCDGSRGDILNLPPYVANVRVIRHGFPGYVNVDRDFLGYSDTNPTYLPLSGRRRRMVGKRGLGRIGFNDAGGGDINCILVDIELAKSVNYSVSIYSVAESTNNAHAIRVMDGKTFNVIAPTPLIEDYTDGVWWTMHYNGSIRLKFLDIKGIFVSAIGFHSSNE
jgi:hypothetical protein